MLCVLSGTKLLAKFKATVFDISGKTPIFSLGQPMSEKKCSDMRYDFKFSKVLPLAVSAAKSAIPQLSTLPIGTLSKALNPLDSLMDKFGLSLKMHSELKDKNRKYFAVSGTTEVHLFILLLLPPSS